MRNRFLNELFVFSGNVNIALMAKANGDPFIGYCNDKIRLRRNKYLLLNRFFNKAVKPRNTNLHGHILEVTVKMASAPIHGCDNTVAYQFLNELWNFDYNELDLRSL